LTLPADRLLKPGEKPGTAQLIMTTTAPDRQHWTALDKVTLFFLALSVALCRIESQFTAVGRISCAAFCDHFRKNDRSGAGVLINAADVLHYTVA